MKILRLLMASGALLATAPAQAKPAVDPQVRLEQELGGWVAGKPRDCINLQQIRSTRIINRTAIIYDMGSIRFLNRPRGGAESLSQWDTLVTDTHSSQLCSIDVVKLYDSSAHMQTSVVFLGEFVPYKKVR